MLSTAISNILSIRGAAISGNNGKQAQGLFRQIKSWLRRHDFSVGMGLLAFLLFGIFVGAIYDFTALARRQDQKIQSSNLSRELADFFLATRDPDGSSLLENPRDFTKENRPLRIVSVNRPFFNYFLTRDNFRTFRTEALRVEVQPACVQSFEVRTSGQTQANETIQACFAVIPEDVRGRFVYFMVRYPSYSMTRHNKGQRLVEGDRLVLNFSGPRGFKVTLVPEQPSQLINLKPALLRRFEGLHEMAGFAEDDFRKPLRQLNAQAVERSSESTNVRQVTVLGRIDASLFQRANEFADVWPDPGLKEIDIGIEVLQPGRATTSFGFAAGAHGRAQASLEHAYRTSISSGADMVVKSTAASGNAVELWRSTNLVRGESGQRDGLLQRLGKAIASLASPRRITVQGQQKVGTLPAFDVTLTTDAVVIPDIAARALGWLVVGALVIAFAAVVVIGVTTRLQRLTRTAYEVTWRKGHYGLAGYSKAKDQIGTLGRALNLFVRRDRNRIAREEERISQIALLREVAMAKEREYVERRKQILMAIGHEIRSPLANLQQSISPTHYQSVQLQRMERAFNALNAANSIEETVRAGGIFLTVQNIAKYLESMVDGHIKSGMSIRLVSASMDIYAVYDDIYLVDVIEHLLNNAQRYVTPGTQIEIRLYVAHEVIVEVFNQGPVIDDVQSIFDLNVSGSNHEGSLGIGLFFARLLMSAMEGSIHAENRVDGVAFVLALPLARDTSVST